LRRIISKYVVCISRLSYNRVSYRRCFLVDHLVTTGSPAIQAVVYIPIPCQHRYLALYAHIHHRGSHSQRPCFYLQILNWVNIGICLAHFLVPRLDFIVEKIVGTYMVVYDINTEICQSVRPLCYYAGSITNISCRRRWTEREALMGADLRRFRKATEDTDVQARHCIVVVD
jgi:hypothetical protein